MDTYGGKMRVTKEREGGRDTEGDRGRDTYGGRMRVTKGKIRRETEGERGGDIKGERWRDTNALYPELSTQTFECDKINLNFVTFVLAP